MKKQQQARENMVDSQIHPLGVVSEDVLNAFLQIPREWFVPESMKAHAYADEDIEIAPGRFLLEPQIQARMIQALELTGQEAVLDIGCLTGYSSAILSQLCSTVIAIDSDKSLLEKAQENWSKCEALTVASYLCELKDGCQEHKPYDVIVMNGSVAQVPRSILSQLKVGGKLIASVRPNPKSCGKATLFERTDENIFAERTFFDTFSPYLTGLEPKNDFSF